ncbi:MAG TPA: peptidylprolyl isomerase [Nitrosopumilaceae archaeon]|nr:peptidylprolyl isomerase [Nitrosopumilaceae archaeon]
MHFNLLSIGLIALLLSNSIPTSFSDSKVAVIETKFGNMVIEFFPEDAPKTVDNFIKLTESGFYDGTLFHRIIKDFMIQGGDPLSKDSNLIQQWGTGDAGYKIPAEFNKIKHNRGIVSMARSTDPDSASSQFFIVQKDSNFLDGKYTVFGRLITEESFKVLDSIASLETVSDKSSGIPLDVPVNYGDAQIHSIKIKNHSEILNILNPGEPDRFVSHSNLDGSGNYQNTLLGFSFHAPDNWLLQEPQKTQPEFPDVVVVGPMSDGFTPVISFLVENTNQTSLDDHVKNTRKNLQVVIDAGRLEILSEENKQIKGYNAHITEAKGGFVSKDKIFVIKYRELVIESGDKFYTMTYTNQEKNFDSDLPTFNAVLDSFKIANKPNVPLPNFPLEIAIGIGIAIAAVIAGIVLKKRKPSKIKT